MTALIIPEGFKVTPEQFDQLALANTNIRLELTANGELIGSMSILQFSSYS